MEIPRLLGDGVLSFWRSLKSRPRFGNAFRRNVMRPLLIAAALLSFAVPAMAIELTIRAFSPSERAAALSVARAGRKEFNKSMLDYPSTRFRDVRASVLKGKHEPMLCGFVNGKNRMGAYVGWQPFALFGPADADDTASLWMDDPGMVEIFCRPSADRDYDTKDYSADLTHSP
jgi:hypothetical protein